MGWTQHLEVRIAQHFLGRGADRTRLFKPLEVVAVSEGGQELEEAQTIALMCRHGWRYVRGGKRTSPALKCQPKPLGIVMARGVPSKEPKTAFLEEFLLIGGAQSSDLQGAGGRDNRRAGRPQVRRGEAVRGHWGG